MLSSRKRQTPSDIKPLTPRDLITFAQPHGWSPNHAVGFIVPRWAETLVKIGPVKCVVVLVTSGDRDVISNPTKYSSFANNHVKNI